MAVPVLGIAALAGWLLLPWRHVDGLTVEAARIMPAGEADGSRRPADIATPRRIAITFSADEDLDAARRRFSAAFMTAKLFACASPERSAREVIVQSGGILTDDGRVVALPAREGRTRYRAIFDDSLGQLVDHRFVFTRAIGVPLCFTLEGGGMFMGRVTAATIPLPPLR